MHEVVRITEDDDGELKNDSDVWHLVDPGNRAGPAALCTAEYFGEGESACIAYTRLVSRGGITCPTCLSILKKYKAIRL